MGKKDTTTVKPKPKAKPKQKKSRPPVNMPVLLKVREALRKNPDASGHVDWLLDQLAHESNGFWKDKAISNNNFGGIKYHNGLSRVATRSNDYLAPAKESKKGVRVPYAHFESLDDFVATYLSHTHLTNTAHENKEGSPISADSIEAFVHRLKLNHYFQDSEANYLRGIKRWNSIIETRLKAFDELTGTIDNIRPPVYTPPLNNALDDLLGYMPAEAAGSYGAGNMQPFGLPDVAGDQMQINTMPAEAPGNVLRVNPLLPGIATPHTSLQVKKISGGVEIIRAKYMGAPDPAKMKDGVYYFNGIPGEKRDAPPLFPGMKSKPVSPAPADNYSIPFLLPFSDAGKFGMNNAQKVESGSLQSPFPDPVKEMRMVDKAEGDISAENINGGRTVNVHLNTPMIGRFSVNTGEGAGLGDLRRQVEEALLEVINSVSTA